MDFASIIGIVVGIVSLVGGYAMDHGSVRSLCCSAPLSSSSEFPGSVAIAYG
jgi:flagellar motor component MotA